MSFKAEMLCQGEWVSNALVFATRGEAEGYASNLFMRWTVPTDKRAVESQEEVNYSWDDEKGLTRLSTGTTHMPPDRVKL
jgi:hypothetical protein